MNIYSRPGAKIIYTGDGGYEGDRIHANKYLEHGEMYTLRDADIHSSSTEILLEEVPGEWFNSVLFEDYSEDISVEEKDRDAENE